MSSILVKQCTILLLLWVVELAQSATQNVARGQGNKADNCKKARLVSIFFGVICFIEVVALAFLIYYIYRLQTEVERHRKEFQEFIHSKGGRPQEKIEGKPTTPEKNKKGETADSSKTDNLSSDTTTPTSPKAEKEKKKKDRKRRNESPPVSSSSSDTDSAAAAPPKKRKKDSTPKEDGSHQKTEKGEPKSMSRSPSTEPMTSGSDSNGNDGKKKESPKKKKRDSQKMTLHSEPCVPSNTAGNQNQ